MEFPFSKPPFCRAMGIRFKCPNGHALHVKSFLAGKRGVCPKCGTSVQIPAEQDLEAVATIAAASAAAAKADDSSTTSTGTTPTTKPLAEPGSQSIVISTAAPSVPSDPEVPPPPASALIPGSEQPTPSPDITTVDPTAPPSANTQPLVVTDEVDPPSAAARYVARRQKNRQMQFMLAIWLLIAVLVLGGVLVWVLSRDGSTAAGNRSTSTNRIGIKSFHADDGLGQHFIAQRAQAAI